MSNIYQPISAFAGAYNAAADLFLSTIKDNLTAAGWQCSNRNPYIYLQMINDMAQYSGGIDSLWEVSPPPGVGGKKKLIVDHPSTTYDPNIYDMIVTGSTSKEVVFPYIVAAFQSFGTIYGGFTEYGSDPNNTTFINTRLLIDENPLMPLSQGMAIPGVGGALNIQVMEHGYGGGYACTCAPNGNSENYVSLFIYRSQAIDSNNNPGPPAMFFAKDISPAPTWITSTPNEDRTVDLNWGLVQTNWHLVAGPSYAIMWHDSNNFLHAQIGALSLPVTEAGLTEATFATAGDIRTTPGFRKSCSCAGIHRLSINNEALYGNSGAAQHTPRLEALWASNNNGNLWENGLGQIHEPWVAFNNKTFRKAARLGKFPDAIMMHKSVDPETFGTFEFDGAIYKPVTRNIVVSSNTGFATLCVKVDDTANNECSLPN